MTCGHGVMLMNEYAMLMVNMQANTRSVTLALRVMILVVLKYSLFIV